MHFLIFVLDADAHTLTKGDAEQDIEPQVFDLLHLLLRNAGKLVTRDLMVDEVWQGRIVSESSISARIAAVRRAVGDNWKSQSIVRTVPRRGLQFVADVSCDQRKEPIAAPQVGSQTIKYATADDGVKLAYAISGDGPPLLRIAHDPTHLELEWNDVIQRPLFEVLGLSRTLVRFDQRGCGLSDVDVADMGIVRDAEDAKSVADAAGLSKFALFGSSSGAMKAVEFAVRYPNQVSHMILLGGYVDGRSVRGNSSSANGTDPILEMTREGWNMPGSAFVKAYLSIYFPTASTEALEYWAEMFQSSSTVENATRSREACNNHSIADLLEQISVPTLIMHARKDSVHPLSEAQKMAKGISNAELLVLESPNHYPLPSEPCWQIHVDAIQDFLNRDV